MKGLRIGAGLLLVAAGAWFLAAVFSEDGGEVQPATTFTSSSQCQECHPTQYAEWERSQHSISWINPAVRDLSNDFANQDCIDCHAPRPVLVTGIGNRVLPRTSRRVEGVDCIACHQLPPEAGGGVAGTITDPRAACRPVETRALASPEFCAGCHDQHQTVQQWLASDWPDRGEDCLSCHMPFRGGDPNAGRDHTFPGGNVPEMVRRAVRLSGERVDGRWVAVIENVGAGHSFPTDERSRAADVFWRPLPSNGSEPGPWRHLHRMRSPYRHETDLPDTLLAAGERRVVPIEDADADGPIEIALFYKRSPYWKDMEHPDPEREALLVQRVVLEP